VLVTKVKVKDDSPNVFVPSASKTEREITAEFVEGVLIRFTITSP